MKTKRTVRLVKRTITRAATVPPVTVPASGRNGCHKAVRSWVIDFKRERQIESFPAFDSLFKS